LIFSSRLPSSKSLIWQKFSRLFSHGRKALLEKIPGYFSVSRIGGNAKFKLAITELLGNLAESCLAFKSLILPNFSRFFLRVEKPYLIKFREIFLFQELEVMLN